MRFSLPSLHDHAIGRPDFVALDPITGPVLTYASLWHLVSSRARALLRDQSEDRPVAFDLDHGIEEAIMELAALDAGIPVLSLPKFFTPEQVQHALSACGAKSLFNSNSAAQGTACGTALVALPHGTARITFTSGSTGTAKGVCLSASHMITVAQSVVEAVGGHHAGRHLALLPPGILLETVAGFFATLLAGGTYVCPPQALVGLNDPFRPDFAIMARSIAEWRITSVILVPEYLSGLVETMERSGLRLPLLTLVAVGGAHTPPALLRRARAVGLPVRQGYGLTECGSVVSLEDGSGDVVGSAGRPLGHISARIAADGEILLNGALCLGTIGAKRQRDWLATGDIGRIDEFGRLWIEGRKSNLIVTSYGRNISPEWVEAALLAQPAIAQALVHGDGKPYLEALLVPASPSADIAGAVTDANASLPAYARVATWQEAAPFTPMNGQLTGNGRLRRNAITSRYLDGEPAFFTQLEAATIRQQMAFLTIPQVQAGLAGRISKSAYIAYLTQAWHHVRHTVPLLEVARDRIAGRAELTAAINDYVREEAAHDEWILADIAAAGGDAHAARRSAPAHATHAMVAHAYDRIENGNPVSIFGMVYVLESVSVALAQHGASAVATNLGLPPEAFTYLTSHGALDQEHMSYFEKLVNNLTDPSDQAAIKQMAQEIFGLFGSIFATIALEDVDVAA